MIRVFASIVGLLSVLASGCGGRQVSRSPEAYPETLAAVVARGGIVVPTPTPGPVTVTGTVRNEACGYEFEVKTPVVLRFSGPCHHWMKYDGFYTIHLISATDPGGLWPPAFQHGETSIRQGTVDVQGREYVYQAWGDVAMGTIYRTYEYWTREARRVFCVRFVVASPSDPMHMDQPQPVHDYGPDEKRIAEFLKTFRPIEGPVSRTP